jgi:type I restriction enzyme S subunit
MSYKIPVPSLKEQNAIVSYLDTATAKIDAAIAQQQKMIDLLNERKQIIINRAVTKGLNPNAKMKDSGVEWIGEVPEHWEVRRLGSLGAFSKGGNISRDDLQEYGKCAILYGDIYTKYNIQTSLVKNHISEKVAEKSVRITKGDLLMTGSGETKEDIGKTIVFHGDESFIGGDVILFRQQNNDSTFLSYALNSQYAKDFRYKESKGEIIVHIYASSLKRLFLALPPIEEQIKVVKYLDGQIDAIDSEIDVINKQISLLQERKQIIINEVVTGKVRVV